MNNNNNNKLMYSSLFFKKILNYFSSHYFFVGAVFRKFGKSQKIKQGLQLSLFLMVLSPATHAVFNPILIDDNNNHRIWKITGNAESIYDLTGKNLNDGIAPDLVEVGSYSLDYNIQDLAIDNNGKTWAIAKGTGHKDTTDGNTYIGQVTESSGNYSFTNITDLGSLKTAYDHGKSLVWDADNKYFIFGANPTNNDPGKTTLKAYDPLTNSVVTDPWGTGNAELVVSLPPVDQGATYTQGLTFGPNGNLYTAIGYGPSYLLKLERNAQHKLTGASTMVGEVGLGIGLLNIEAVSFTDNGKLLVIESDGGTEVHAGRVYTIDLSTGKPTEVANLDNGYAYTRDWEGIQFYTPVYSPNTPKCFAMTDDVAELYSFDLNINTVPTKIVTDRILNGEAATYRATDNAIYTFHQDLVEQDESKPSDLYKVEMDGTITLIKAAFLSRKANGAEFIHYADGSEHLMTLQYKNHSAISIFDATDLVSATPLKTIPLLLPDGSDARVDGLAVNPNTGEVLVVDDNQWESVDFAEIYSVNMTTGQLTLLTTLTVQGIDAESLAFAEDGFLYTENDEEESPDSSYHHKIFRVDLATGDLTAVEKNIDNIVSGDIEGMSCTGSKIITPPVNTFSCTSELYVNYVTSGSYATGEEQLVSINLLDGTTIADEKVSGVIGVTSLGYNIKDNFLWGYNMGNKEIVRIDANYNTKGYGLLGLDDELYSGADVSQDGILHLSVNENFFNFNQNRKKIARINLNGATPVKEAPLVLNETINALDIAFNPIDNNIYFIDQAGIISKITLSANGHTGTVSIVGDTGLGNIYTVVSGFDKHGAFYFNNTNASTTDIWKATFNNAGTSIASITKYKTLEKTLTQGDGAMCANASIGTNLTVVHQVINDNGGTNTGADFGITSDHGTLVFSSAQVSGDTSTYTSNSMIIPAGDTTLTAPALSGYAHTASWWSCSGSQELVTLNSMSNGTLTATVTIAESDSVTCTVTYDDEASCGALSGEVNVAISPISILRTETNEFKNKLFEATTDNDDSTGHLRAYPIGANELPSSTASWDAASVMTTQRRATHLFSTVDNRLVAFNVLPEASFLSSGSPSFEEIRTNVAAADIGSISPNSKVTLLENKVNPLMYLDELDYRSFYTSTIANRSAVSGATVPSQVMVSSDDGFLYSFNQSDGNLNWGWMPPSLALELKHAAQFAGHHYMQGTMDQLDLKSGSSGSYSFASYIAGSYRDGLGQYVLKLADDSSLDSVIWNTDHKSANSLADGAPNHGQRAYFSDANGKPYMVYIITASGTDSVLHIRSMTDALVHEQVVLGFTATSTPFVMPDFRKAASPTINTLYLGDNNGNIYSADLLTDDAGGHKTVINANLSNSFGSSATPLETIHPTGQSSSPVLYIGATLAVGGQYHLYAQAEDRFTVFNYNSSGTNWSPNWTTSAGGAGKWVTSEGTSTYEADTAITALTAGDRLTDQAYLIANSIVLPITAAPVPNACHGIASYSFYKLPNGQTPTKTFYNTSDHSAITSGTLTLGTGETKRMHLTTLPKSKKLIALGLAEQGPNASTGVSNSFYINDPVTAGIRSWKELH